jgi:glucose/arabinose dehydrogenase
VSTIAGIGTAGAVDGNCSVASFNQPYDVKVDHRDGSLLVADRSNNKIRKISPQGR